MAGHAGASVAAQYTVAIIFALHIEMRAFRCVLDETFHDDQDELELEQPVEDENDYVLGRVGRHKVVLACLPETQGTGAATIVVTNLGRTFPRIRWRLLVGVGGGVASEANDVRLGDVVVSTPRGGHGGVVQYDMGKATLDGWKRTGFLAAPPTALRSTIQKLRSDPDVDLSKAMRLAPENFPKLRNGFLRPDGRTDMLFPEHVSHAPSSRLSCENCAQELVIQRPPRSPEGESEVHYGLIASGNSLVRSPNARHELIKRIGSEEADNILCFEMEAAGVSQEKPCLVIRGIADYADSHKNKLWQPYAAANAAIYARELLLRAKPERSENEGAQGRSSANSRALDLNGAIDDDRHRDERRQPATVVYRQGSGVQHNGPGTMTLGSLTFNNYHGNSS